MKKSKRILLAVVLVVIAAVVALAIWQWNTLKAVYYFSTIKTSNEIVEKIDEQKKNREELVSQYVEGTVRDFTEEEEKKIIDGTMTVDEAVQIIKNEFNSSADKTENPKTPVSSGKKKEVDDYIAESIIQLYSYKAYYLGQLGQIEKAAKADYKALPVKERNLVSKQSIVDKYLGTANALLIECDGKVHSIMSSIEKKLKENNMDASIVKQIEKSYEEEKALKKAYYMSLLKE